MSDPKEATVICGLAYAFCLCGRSVGHAGVHVCNCGGAYRGVGQPVAMPIREGLLSSAEIESLALRLEN